MADRPDQQFYLVGDENGPLSVLLLGNRRGGGTTGSLGFAPTRSSPITASAQVASLQPQPPFTLLMSRQLLQRAGAGLADRFPNGRVRNVMPDGTLVAFEVPGDRAVSG